VIKTQQQDDEHLSIRISDNGIGIQPEILEHIFDPFFSSKPEGQGTGLGLAICWNIVKAHNGTIQATTDVARGSVISIVLTINKVVDE